jgi:hypothetical protein
MMDGGVVSGDNPSLLHGARMQFNEQYEVDGRGSKRVTENEAG